MRSPAETLLLAIETSTAEASIALVSLGHPDASARTGSPPDSQSTIAEVTVLGEKIWRRDRSHSEVAHTYIQELLQTHQLRLEQITHLAVGRGPGSFTGIRVAIGIVKALAYAYKIPVMAYTTHNILAFQASFDHMELHRSAEPVSHLPKCLLVNAHKNLVYAEFLEPDQTTANSAIEALSIEEIQLRLNGRKYLCIGDAFDEWKSFMSPELLAMLQRSPDISDWPLASSLGRMAMLGLQTGRTNSTHDWNSVQALYVRGSEAEENLRDGRLKDLSRIEDKK